MAPQYLNQLVPVSSLPGSQRLQSSFTLQLQFRLSTAGCRSFPVTTSILEHSARRRAVCTVCLFLPATAKDILVLSVISWHFSLNFILRSRGLCNSLGCFSHAKVLDWHWHWLSNICQTTVKQLDPSKSHAVLYGFLLSMPIMLQALSSQVIWREIHQLHYSRL